VVLDTDKGYTLDQKQAFSVSSRHTIKRYALVVVRKCCIGNELNKETVAGKVRKYVVVFCFHKEHNDGGQISRNVITEISVPRANHVVEDIVWGRV
jgi:hypothetical protein